MSDFETNKVALANAFVAVLTEWLTPEQMFQVRRRNAQRTSELVCHSHDFCDANMAMDQAFKKVIGRDPLDYLNHDEEGSMDEADVALWNAAWEYAVRSYLTERFLYAFPDYPVEAFPDIPEGFEDVSWGNDTCPSIVSDNLEMLIWIDFPEVKHREYADGKRFVAVRQVAGIETGSKIIVETDDWNEVLKAIEERRAAS
jgi:hypothetical protein